MSNFEGESLQEGLKRILEELEADQQVYDAYLKDRTRRKEDLQVVHMKSFFDLIAFNALRRYASDYVPGEFIGKKLAQELSTVGDFVSIVDKEIQISPAYEEFLAVKASYTKTKSNGTIH